MEFDEIILSITEGLTGEKDKDKDYLLEKMKEYKDHEYGKEIIETCTKLLLEKILNQESLKMLELLYGNQLTGEAAILSEVEFLVYKKKYDKAAEICSLLIKSFEKMLISDNEYNFQEEFERALFLYYKENDEKKENNGKKEEIHQIDHQVTEAYLIYGSIMIDLGQYDKAVDSLKTAYRFDPASCKVAFEYGEALKLTGNLKKSEEITRQCFLYAYTPTDIARCYRNLGFFLTEAHKFKAAIMCYQLSLQYENSPHAMSELYYIQEKFGEKRKQFSTEEIREIAIKEDFPVTLNPVVKGLSLDLGKFYIDEGKIDLALYFLNIYTALTHDPAIEEYVNKFKNLQNQKNKPIN